MSAAGEGIAGLCWSQYLSSQETEPQLIEQTAHIWGGSFYLCLPSPENPFYSLLNLLSTCLSTLNNEESLREEVVFALSILETMDLQFLQKHGGKLRLGVGSREWGQL